MLSDLIFVLRFLKKTIEEGDLLGLYNSYITTLEQISQSFTQELQEQLHKNKDDILKAHDKLDPVGWSFSQVKVYNLFGAAGLVGKNGIENFNKVLIENSANVGGALDGLRRQREEISVLLTNTNNVLSGLNGLVGELSLSENSAMVQIVFDEKVSIDNFIDLSRRSKEWNLIIRAYSLLANESPEDTKIVGANKGSPYTLLLVVPQLVAKAIHSTIKPFLDLYSEVLEAKKHACELEKMRIGIKCEEYKLFEQIDTYERKRVEEILTQVIEIDSSPGLDSALKSEAKNALLKAGPDLYQFLVGGGKIDTTLKREDVDKDKQNIFQLNTQYQEVSKLQLSVKQMLSERNSSSVQTIPEEKVEDKKENTGKKVKN